MTYPVIHGRKMPIAGTCHGISKGFLPHEGAGKPLEALMNRFALPLILSIVAGPALALEPINKEAHIVETLIQGFVADAIDDNCSTISARKLRALGELNTLANYALEKGYSRAEITAFVKDKAEKARGKAEAAARLKKRGAVAGKEDAYCAIGEEEIAKGSLIGQLLRSDK